MKKRLLTASVLALASLSLFSCVDKESPSSTTNIPSSTPATQVPSTTPSSPAPSTPAPTQEAHQHSYSSTWSFNSSIHWYACECDEELKNSAAAHDDADNDGDCNVCGYVYDESHKHTYSEDWKSDATAHWHEATCDHSVKGDYEEHGTANKYGNCPTCGTNIQDATPTTVETAVEFAKELKANVKYGIFNNDGLEYKYEYTDKYFTFNNEYSDYYFYPNGNSVLGVEVSDSGDVYSAGIEIGSLDGIAFDGSRIGYEGEFYYGAEGLLDALYSLAKENYNGDFTENVSKESDVTYYSFSFSDFNYESENYYKYLYDFDVTFTLSETGELATLEVYYDEYEEQAFDWNTYEYITNVLKDETTGYYYVVEGANPAGSFTLVYENNYEIVEEEMPDYSPSVVLVDSCDLANQNTDEVYTDTINMTVGTTLNIVPANVAPATYIPALNTAVVYMNGEICDYSHSILNAYYSSFDGCFYFNAYKAGTYEITVTYGNWTKNYTLVVTQPDPTYINAASSSNGFSFESATEVEIYVGESIYISALVDENANDAYTAAMTSENATLTLVEGESYYLFTSNTIGEYTITVTSSVVSTLTNTITVKVVEAPSVADLLNGSYEAQFYGTKMYEATFTPENADGTSGAVVFTNSQSATTGTYSYTYSTATNIVLTFVSGTDIAADGVGLKIESGVLYSYNQYNSFAMTKVESSAEETPDVSDLLNGSYESQFYGTIMYEATFTPENENGTVGTVVFTNSQSATTGTYSYTYSLSNNIVLTFVSGTDITSNGVGLKIENGVLYSYNQYNSFEMTKVESSGSEGGEEEESPVDTLLTQSPNWANADGSITASFEYDSTFNEWTLFVVDSNNSTTMVGYFQSTSTLSFGAYICTTTYSMQVEGTGYVSIEEVEVSFDLSTIIIYFDEYDVNVTFTVATGEVEEDEVTLETLFETTPNWVNEEGTMTVSFTYDSYYSEWVATVAGETGADICAISFTLPTELDSFNTYSCTITYESFFASGYNDAEGVVINADLDQLTIYIDGTAYVFTSVAR